MFNFSFFDVVKIIVLSPFMLAWHLIKVLFVSKKDTKLMDELYDLLDELEYFINFIRKGPTTLERYKIKNTLFEYHLNLAYISNVREEQNVIGFRVKIGDSSFTSRSGGWGAGGTRYYHKKDYNIESVANDLYDVIERSYNIRTNPSSEYYKETSYWRVNTKDVILKKYNADFYALRRAFIIMSHKEDHPRHINAKAEIIQFFGSGDKAALFVNEIEDAYISKSVVDALTR